MKHPLREALVTGATGELGSEICRTLAAYGLDVVVSDRDETEVADLVEELSRYPGCTATSMVLDLSDHEAMQAGLSRLVEERPQIDLLVANAGLDVPQPIEQLDWRIAKRHFDVHVIANYVLVGFFVPRFLARGHGHVCSVISLGALMGVPYEHAYNGSKAAVRMMIDGLRAETSGRGVGFTSAFPGFLRGRMATGNAYKVTNAVPMRAAAERIVAATLARSPVVRFPLGTWLQAAIASVLPIALRDRLARRIMER